MTDENDAAEVLTYTATGGDVVADIAAGLADSESGDYAFTFADGVLSIAVTVLISVQRAWLLVMAMLHLKW